MLLLGTLQRTSNKILMLEIYFMGMGIQKLLSLMYSNLKDHDQLQTAKVRKRVVWWVIQLLLRTRKLFMLMILIDQMKLIIFRKIWEYFMGWIQIQIEVKQLNLLNKNQIFLDLQQNQSYHQLSIFQLQAKSLKFKFLKFKEQFEVKWQI